MDIKSGKRKQIRLELDRDIFKTFEITGTNLNGSKIVDISHYGMGIIFDDGINKFSTHESVSFTITFDKVAVKIKGIVKHAGSKFVGIEFEKISSNKEKFYDYIDSRIIKKFDIAPSGSIRGLLIQRLDVKTIILLLILEALLILGGVYIYNFFKERDDPFNYLQGKNTIKTIFIEHLL